VISLPPPVLEHIEGIQVVRDDLLPGGTKRRALHSVLPLISADEFVYASPAAGYAQIALAYACRDFGRQATIFTAKRKVLHRCTQEAHRAGAKIVLVPTGYLTNVQAKARAYSEAADAYLLPFGLDTDEFRKALAAQARGLGITPDEVWAVAGSGTLIRALQAAWPGARFNAVRIGREPKIGDAMLYQAPEQFEQDATIRPPFPSSPNYDAKAWRFIKARAGDNALFWNVGA
jgi:hypothetical protein